MGNCVGMGIATRCEIRSKGDESLHITFCPFELSHSLLNRAACGSGLLQTFGQISEYSLSEAKRKGGPLPTTVVGDA